MHGLKQNFNIYFHKPTKFIHIEITCKEECMKNSSVHDRIKIKRIGKVKQISSSLFAANLSAVN